MEVDVIIQIFIAIFGTAVTILIVFTRYLNSLDKRVAVLETCVDGRSLAAIDQKTDIFLEWIRSLNGKVSNQDFLKKLEKVTQELEEESKKRLNPK